MADDLRVFFFPFMAPGQMIPMLDMATLFAGRGVWATIVTTPGNEHVVRPTIERSLSATARPIALLLLPFPPSVRHLLPNGAENFASVPSSNVAMMSIFTATLALREPLEDLLRLHRPHCIVSDEAFSWTSDLGLPRIVYEIFGAFPLCVLDAAQRGSLHLGGSDPFVVHGLPHLVELTRAHIPDTLQPSLILDARREAKAKSLGVVVNSFRELEPDYADFYRRTTPRAWFVGPVALCHRDELGRAGRGRDPSRPGGDHSEAWRSWLDVRPNGSVLYVSFGSMCAFGVHKLREMAAGLESSGHPFLWVVRGAPDEWLPELEELKERVAARGLVLDEWAPQVPILSHPAVGGFLMQCGWNSMLEGVTAGVPMATWPFAYEQFITERMIVDVLEVGVRVKSGKGEAVTAQELAAAVAAVMERGKAAEERRQRVRGYAEAARMAMEKGGSSYNDTGRLIKDLAALPTSREEGGTSYYNTGRLMEYMVALLKEAHGDNCD